MMRLNPPTAQALVTLFRRPDVEARLAESRGIEAISRKKVAIQQNLLRFETELNDNVPEDASIEDLSQFLLALRNQILDTQSCVLAIEGFGDVRVFPHRSVNLIMEVDDVFGRGLDAAQAAIEILKQHYKGNLDSAELNEAISIIKRRLVIFQKKLFENHSLKSYKKELAYFNGALGNLLIKTGACEDERKAKASINFVRDFLWKRSFQNEIICSEIPCPYGIDDRRNMQYRLAKPIEVATNMNSPWHSELADSEWYLQLTHRTGVWLEDFVAEHRHNLARLATTPMSRQTPNPANAFDTSIINVNADGRVLQVLNSTQTGITEPYEVKDKADRTKLTFYNHQALVFGQDDLHEPYQRLQAAIRDHFEKWPDLEIPSEIIIPILHQTLVGDSILPERLGKKVIPDQQKSTTMLENKAFANKMLQQELKQYRIYYNKTNGEIVFLPKNTEQQPEPFDQFVKVNIAILQTNDCVNRHYKYSFVRNHDMRDCHRLLELAAEQLNSASVHPNLLGSEIANDLLTIINFIEPGYSVWEPYHYRGDRVKQAHARLKDFLRNNANFIGDDSLSLITRNNILLLAQAATELRITSNETYGGMLHRRYNNSLGQIPVIGYGFRFLGNVVAGVGKIRSAPTALAKINKHGQVRRTQYHKAVSAAMVAELLGMRYGGCMSSADRAEELIQYELAQYRRFMDLGSIVSMNDAREERDNLLDLYGSTEEKHNLTYMATGSPASHDSETKPWLGLSGGLMCEIETSAEQKISKILGSTRKGAYYFDTPLEEFLGERPVAVTPEELDEQIFEEFEYDAAEEDTVVLRQYAGDEEEVEEEASFVRNIMPRQEALEPEQPQAHLFHPYKRKAQRLIVPFQAPSHMSVETLFESFRALPGFNAASMERIPSSSNVLVKPYADLDKTFSYCPHNSTLYYESQNDDDDDRMIAALIEAKLASLGTDTTIELFGDRMLCSKARELIKQQRPDLTIAINGLSAENVLLPPPVRTALMA